MGYPALNCRSALPPPLNQRGREEGQEVIF
jgi:hypothetical protein